MTKQRQRARRKVTPLVGRTIAWAWAIQNDSGKWVLCQWAEPTSVDLKADAKPSPEARKIRVYLVPANARPERGARKERRDRAR